MHTLPSNFDPTSTTNPVCSGTQGGGYRYLRIAEIPERYGSGGSSGRVGARARLQRDRTSCTMCACRRACSPACTRGERCSPLDPGWGPAAPTSPRCWSSGNNLNQVSLPTLATSSPPHSPSASPRLPARAVVSHAFARGTGRYDRASWSPRTPCTLSGAARAPLQHHLRVDAPYRPRAAVIACGVRSGRVCMSSPGCTAGTVFTHVEPEMRMYMIV